VIEASDGLDGLERARSQRPHLVLTDVSMPGLDGFELAESLRLHEDTSRIPIAFMTGHVDEGYEARGSELGAVAFLHKPFDGEALTAVAFRALSSLEPEPM
jgi:CheY-like chemotaxis protein